MHEDQSRAGHDPDIASGDAMDALPSLSWGGGRAAALAHFLAQPSRPMLTDEQAAIALSITRDLCRQAVLAIADEGAVSARDRAATTFDLLLANGLESASILAVPVLARVEEYRWRRTGEAGLPARRPPQHMVQAADTDAPHLEDSTGDAEAAIAQSFLNLRVADGARHGPVLPLAEMARPARCALIDDVAAALLAQADGVAEEEAILAAARTLRAIEAPAGIDVAGRGYADALAAASIQDQALLSLIERREWLGVLALVAVRNDMRYADAAATVLLAPPGEALALLARAGLDNHVSAEVLAASRRDRDDPPAPSRDQELLRRAALLRARRAE